MGIPEHRERREGHPVGHLEALFARARPGVTREQIAEEAGIAAHQIHYLFRPDRTERLPRWTMLRVVAEALGAHAKAAQDEQDLLDQYRALAPRDRRVVRSVVQTPGGDE